MKRSTFRRRQHRVRADLNYAIKKHAWAAESRERRLKAALTRPGAKVAASEIWGAADRRRTFRDAKRSAVWAGARL